MIFGRKIIALCTAQINKPLCRDYLATLSNRLSMHGFSVLVYNMCASLSWNDAHESPEGAVYDLIEWEKIDIAIIMDERLKSRSLSLKIIAKAEKYGKPVIMVDGDYDKGINIRFDYENGFEAITRHVIEHHKRKKVYFMGGIPGNSFSETRKEIYLKVMRENGLEVKDHMISHGYFWPGGAQEAAMAIISSGELPDAIICANDIMALNTMLILQKSGIEVPDQVIVTGFDGIDEIYFSTPQLTSCICNYEKIANLTADIILKIYKNPDAPKPDKKSLASLIGTVHKLPLDVIIAGSCGCCESRLTPPNYLTQLNNRTITLPDETRSIFRIMETMQNARTTAEASVSMKRDSIHSIDVIVNKSYTLWNNNPALRHDGPVFEDDMFLFFRSDDEYFVPRDIKKTDIMEDFKTFIQSGFPLVFNALDYINIPFGFVCFHFPNYSELSYTKIPLIITSIRNAIGGFATIQYQKYMSKQMEEIYKIDTLTGLFNRAGFARNFRDMQDRLKSTGGHVTVILSDLDRLKKINDIHGHSAGDNAIQQSARALKLACPDDALCVRFGGDELLAVIEGDADTDKIKEKINAYLEEYNSSAGRPYKVSSSIGTYKTTGKDDIDFETLVKKADESMYKEKEEHHKIMEE